MENQWNPGGGRGNMKIMTICRNVGAALFRLGLLGRYVIV